MHKKNLKECCNFSLDGDLILWVTTIHTLSNLEQPRYTKYMCIVYPYTKSFVCMISWVVMRWTNSSLSAPGIKCKSLHEKQNKMVKIKSIEFTVGGRRQVNH